MISEIITGLVFFSVAVLAISGAFYIAKDNKKSIKHEPKHGV